MWKRDESGRLLSWVSHLTMSNEQHVSVAAFDLDYTLITKGSPRSACNWTWLDPSVLDHLKMLHDDGFVIAVFTNQKSICRFGKSYEMMVRHKIERVVHEIPFPVMVFVACDDDQTFRKPATGMWDALGRALEPGIIDKTSSFFVGDAAGRPQDFSDCDRKFAENVGIAFETPEEFFGFGAA